MMGSANVTAFPRRFPPTVLVIEDDVLTRCLVSDELRAKGFKVLEVSSAEDAIKVLDTMRADLVLVDIHLAGSRSGLEVARHVRGRSSPIQVIITSGREEVSSIPDLEKLGHFLPKPYPPSRAVDLVMRSLNWPDAPDGSAMEPDGNLGR
jgi:DNA-binding NtrC family response regulator